MAAAGPINFITGNAGMQIDFPDNIKPKIADNNAVTNPKTDGFSATTDSLNTALAADYSGVISRAVADCGHVDGNLIAEARLLIDSGQLNRPETIDLAGQNILKSGI